MLAPEATNTLAVIRVRSSNSETELEDEVIQALQEITRRCGTNLCAELERTMGTEGFMVDVEDPEHKFLISSTRLAAPTQ
jgi:enamine deaminase RidA (YjgF/YER057c/UK114 family)